MFVLTLENTDFVYNTCVEWNIVACFVFVVALSL